MRTAKLTDLRPAAYNPRRIAKRDLEALKRSMQEFGVVEPIVINTSPGRENVVIGGHQRIVAARELGLKTIPVIPVKLTLKREKVLNLALNRISGAWDEPLLTTLISEIEKEDPEGLNLTGFDEKEINRMLFSDGSGEVPEDDFRVEEAWEGTGQTKKGDLVELGPHRLLCGDARDPATFEKLMGKDKSDMIFTDPPYNVDYQGGRLGKIMNDAQRPEQFGALLKDALGNALNFTRGGGAFYICMGWSGYPALMDSMRGFDIHLANVILWVKDSAPLGFHDYRYQHETLVKGTKGAAKKAESLAYGWKKGEHYFAPIRDEADVWQIPKRRREYVHPTQKPLSLIARAIRNSTKTGQIVLDPFGGSGSTLIAADITGRRCRTSELDPKYCDVIRKRYEKHAAQKTP